MLKWAKYAAAAAGMALCLGAAPSFADTYPDRPVRILVGFSAGGATDLVARLYASKLEQQLGTPVLVENKAGASGTIAAAEVANAPADGYTLIMIASSSHVFYPIMSKNPRYDPINDFTHIAMGGVAPTVITVSPELGVETLSDFVQLLKDNPNKYTFGSSGVGAMSHFSAELFQETADVEMQHAPYKGSSLAMQDVINGHIATHMDTFTTGLEHHRSGTVRILAVAAKERSASAPDIPTTAEAGLPEMVSNTFYALLGPKNLPDEVMNKLSDANQKIMKDAQFVERMNGFAIEIDDASPAETKAFIQSEIDKWRPIITKTGVTVD